MTRPMYVPGGSAAARGALALALVFAPDASTTEESAWIDGACSLTARPDREHAANSKPATSRAREIVFVDSLIALVASD